MKLTNLPNQLRVVTHTTDSENILITIYASGGILYENIAEHGISHMTEHLFIKYAEGITSDDMMAMNKYHTASTVDDMVYLTFHFPVSKIDFFLKVIFSSLLAKVPLPLEICDNEKEIILNEFLEHDDSNTDPIYHLFSGSVIGKPVLGSKESIKSFTPKQLFDWHRRMFEPQNMVIGIAMNAKHQQEYEKEIIDKLALIQPYETSLEALPITNIKSAGNNNNIYISENIHAYNCVPIALNNKNDHEYALAHVTFEIIRQKLFVYCEQQHLYNCTLEKIEYNRYFQLWQYDFYEEERDISELVEEQNQFLLQLPNNISPEDISGAIEAIIFEMDAHHETLSRYLDIVCEYTLKGEGYDEVTLKQIYQNIRQEDVIGFLQKYFGS